MTADSLARRQRAEQLAATLPPLLVAAERVASVVAQGVHGRRRVGIGETFWQYRRYQPGDAATRIDWRQSAKTLHLFIRENEWEAAESIWLWCDASPSMRYHSALAPADKAERAALLLLALAVLLVRGGEQVALLGENRRPSGGGGALNRLVAAIEHHAGGEASLPPAAALPRYAQVVLIGDFLAPLDAVEAMVKHFVGGGVKGHLVQIVDPAEEALPFSGRTWFEGLEDEGELLVGRPESLRSDYVARFVAHREGLGDLARAAGWSFATHHTDRPAQEALLALYGAMSAPTMAR
ncbi:MAG: DUF58 domain-containing protein [Alphaproteobacteria bacterium]